MKTAVRVASSQPFTAAPAPATTVPATMGVIQLPAGFMNTVGKTIRVCGNITEASSGSTATISTMQFFFWDAQGSNVTGGYPVLLNNLEATNTLVTSNADVWNFCQDLQTTVAGSGATAGSIQAMLGQLIEGYGTVGAHTYAAFNTNAAAIASLNLAVPARLQVVYLHVTGTDGATPILSDLTVQVLN